MSTTETDYYTLLDIPRNASENDIKKAYRKMALRWHPDKNPGNLTEAETMFKEISAAYEVLSDKQKRDVYDRYGKSGLNGNGTSSQYSGSSGSNHFHTFFNGRPFGTQAHFRDPFDVFREFFGGRDPFGNNFPFGGSDPFGNNFPFGNSDPFGNNFPFGNSFSTGNQGVRMNISSSGTGFSSFNSGSMPSSVKMVSTSTQVINGRRVVTKRVVENGIDTVTIEENGVVTSKSINGVAQPISTRRLSSSSSTARHH